MTTEANTETAVKIKKDLSIFDGLQVPVFVVDRDGKIVHSNDVFAELVGRKREQLEGVAITSLNKVEESGMERALSGESICIETWATIKNKKYFFEMRLTPTYDSKGNVTGAMEVLIRSDRPEAGPAGSSRTDRQGHGRRSFSEGQCLC